MDRRNFNRFVLSVQQRTEKHTGKQIIEFHSISFRVVKIQSQAGICMKCILIFWGCPSRSAKWRNLGVGLCGGSVLEDACGVPQTRSLSSRPLLSLTRPARKPS